MLESTEYEPSLLVEFSRQSLAFRPPNMEPSRIGCVRKSNRVVIVGEPWLAERGALQASRTIVTQALQVLFEHDQVVQLQPVSPLLVGFALVNRT
jgi:hypothetical protein